MYLALHQQSQDGKWLLIVTIILEPHQQKHSGEKDNSESNPKHKQHSQFAEATNQYKQYNLMYMYTHTCTCTCTLILPQQHFNNLYTISILLVNY